MNSNNDLMDPNWKPSPPDAFEIAYNEWYRKFNGVPNAVQVRLFCHEYIKKQEYRVHVLTEKMLEIKMLSQYPTRHDIEDVADKALAEREEE